MNIIVAILALVLSPFFAALLLKVKAWVGGAKGPSIWINYSILKKLLFKKSSVYSETTSFVFKLAPIISFSVMLIVFLFFPFAGERAIFSFSGDIIFIAYLLGLGRFFTIIAALDTGSPFEGMGASREAFYPLLAEMTFFTVLIFLYNITRELSFSNIFSQEALIGVSSPQGISFLLISMAFFLITLSENSQIPIDDPATHLELIMIHEVMILDHSGPDLGMLHLAANLKLMFYVALTSKLIMPFYSGYQGALLFFLVVFIIYLLIGLVASVLPRYKLSKIPKFLITAFAFAFLANIILKEIF